MNSTSFIAFRPATIRRQTTWRRFAGAAMLVCAVALVSPPAHATPASSFSSKKVQLTAREQPIGAFLQDLFGQVEVPVVISPALKGSVNGSFSADAGSVMKSLSKAFSLVMYFDGAVMHVYPSSEMLVRTLPVASSALATRVLRAAEEMDLPDAHNNVRVTRDGVVTISGTPRFVEQVLELTRVSTVKASAPPGMAFKVFYLRYAWAQDVTVNFGGRQMVVPGVASTLKSLVLGNGGSSMVVQDQMTRPTQPKLRGQGLASQGKLPVLGVNDQSGGRQQSDADILATAYGGTQGRGQGGQMQGQGDNMMVQTHMGDGGQGYGGSVGLGNSSQVRIEVDKRLNAVIVRDAPERLPFYEQLIQSLDVEPQSLEIEATIIDINTDRATELGINWRANVEGKSSVLFGNGTSSDTRLQPGSGPFGSAITPSARGGVISAVLGDASQFVARISALQNEGAARVVSSPQVMTLSNVEAIFDSSSTFYVKVGGYQEVDLFNVTAGTTLRVTPHVFKDAEGIRIKLLVNLEDGTLSRKQQAVEGLPVVERSTVNTQALIYEGESLLIGGLTRESSENTSDKVPGLGNIPIIGNLFKYKRDSGGRIERMFLISPRLATRRPAGTTPSANMNSRVAPNLQARSLNVPPLPSPPPNAPPVRQQSAPPIVAPNLRPEAPVVTPPASSEPKLQPSGCGSSNGCEPSAMVVPSRWQSSTRAKGG